MTALIPGPRFRVLRWTLAALVGLAACGAAEIMR